MAAARRQVQRRRADAGNAGAKHRFLLATKAIRFQALTIPGAPPPVESATYGPRH